jgi:phytoene dehydrogenase-like protein
MHAELTKNGVDTRIRCDVSKILVGPKGVRGVVVNGKEIRCKAVISNSNLRSTIFQMVGPEHFDAKFVADAQEVRLNNSSTQVYMAMKPGVEIPESTGDLLFCSTAPVFRTDLLLDRNITSRTFSFYYPRTRPHAKQRYAIVSSTNANWSDWAELNEDEYEASKQDLIETTLDALEKYVPNCREKIELAEAATPRTFHHYTKHLAGASFGTKFEGLGVSRALPQQIHGLYHAGSVGIIMSGWLGAINYGVIVSNEVDQMLCRSMSSAAPASRPQ